MNADLIRAWKDEAYRNGLTAEQLAAMPANPAGVLELTEDELAGVDGAISPIYITATIFISIVWATINLC